MDPATAAAIITAGGQTANGILGMIGQRARENRAMENQRKLMDVQFQHQKELDKYGQELQLSTWQQTSYPAQVAMLKEAGLNPGLLYGNGGSGGVTGSQGGGSAASGSAPSPQPWPLDIGNAIKTGAEIALLKAQTNKTNAEANVVEQTGIPEAQTRIAEAGYRMENLKAVTENEEAKNAVIKAQEQWQLIQNDIASRSADELVNQVFLNNQNLATTIRTNLVQAKVSEETIDEAIKQVRQATIAQGIRIQLEKQGILKAEAETDEIRQHIEYMCQSLDQGWISLDQEQKKIEISKLLAKFNTNTPSHVQQWTGIIGALISGAKQATSTISDSPTIIKGFK